MADTSENAHGVPAVAGSCCSLSPALRLPGESAPGGGPRGSARVQGLLGSMNSDGVCLQLVGSGCPVPSGAACSSHTLHCLWSSLRQRHATFEHMDLEDILLVCPSPHIPQGNDLLPHW